MDRRELRIDAGREPAGSRTGILRTAAGNPPNRAVVVLVMHYDLK